MLIKNNLILLLGATALSAGVYITPAYALPPSEVATIVDSAGVDLTPSQQYNSELNGVQISGSHNGIVIEVLDAINATNPYGVYALETVSGDVSVTFNKNVKGVQRGVQAQSYNGSATVTGSGNASADTAVGIYAGGTAGITVSGTGDTTTTGTHAIYAFTNSGAGNTTINREGTISGVDSGIYSKIDHAAANTDALIITGIGAVSASGSSSKTIYMDNSTKGALTLDTSNAITNTGSGRTYGVYAKSDAGLINITVDDITMDAASTGYAIYLDNSSNSTNSTSININGTVTSGLGNGGAGWGIVGSGNAAQSTNITIGASGILNGTIELLYSDKTTSILQNNGVWNAYGIRRSVFQGKLINNGTINIQDNQISADIYLSNGATLSSTSIIKVDADDSGKADILYGQGDDIILDGTLDVNAIGDEALYSATSGITYTLFQNFGGSNTSGSFATLIDNLANLDLEVNIIGDKVVYHFVASAIDFKSHTDGSNQDGAATAMDDFDYSTTDGQTLKTAFAALTNDEAENAIKQISGGDHQGASQSGAGIASGFQSAMMGGANGGTTGGANGGGNSEPQVTGYTVSATGDVPAIGTAIWARALAGYSKLDKGTTAADLTTNTFGVVGGVEYYVSDDATFGLSSGYTRANFSVQTTGSSSYADNFHAGVSARLGASSAFDTGFGLSVGADATQHNYHTKRNIVIGAVTSTATSDYSGVTIGGTATARYGMNIGNNLVVSPFAGLDASQTSNAAVAETGAGLLNISTDASSSQKLGSTIGFGLAGKVGDISASISAAWRHEYGNVNHTTTNTLAGSPTSYTSTTPTEARNKIMLNANASLPLSDNSSVTFSTFGDLSRTTVNIGASASYKLKF